MVVYLKIDTNTFCSGVPFLVTEMEGSVALRRTIAILITWSCLASNLFAECPNNSRPRSLFSSSLVWESAMASTWPDFALNTAAKRRKIDILEQCLRHGSSPQTTGSDLAADVSSDDNLKDSIISAWGIITSAVNVFSSDEDIAKIVKILITFASLAPTAEEAGIDSNLYATRSWTTLGWTLNENDWNGGSATTFCTIYTAY